MTKADFVAKYREVIVAAGYEWTKNPERVDRAMAIVTRTLNGESKEWDHTGPSTLAAWRAIGGKGKPTLKALRALA